LGYDNRCAEVPEVEWLIQPNVAYCVAGKVNGADKLCPVIESAFSTPSTTRVPLIPFPLTARKGP
jgi:hypothetical protein